MAELTLKFSTLSRNAIIKECINAYVLDPKDKDQEIYELQRHINALHIQLNPDWKRKKSLPFHDEQMYKVIPNYDQERIRHYDAKRLMDAAYEKRKSNDLTPNGGDEK